MVHSPSILVLDEPFEAVDPISAQTIQAILRDYAAAGGTVVISSHVMATVQRLCDHVAIINAGRVVAAGTTEQVAAGGDLEQRFTELVGAQVFLVRALRVRRHFSLTRVATMTAPPFARGPPPAR